MSKTDVFSWTLQENNVISKRLDKSFFETGVTGIPIDIRWFFNCEEIQKEKIYIGLWFQNIRYDAYIETYSDIPSKRTRLFTRKFYTQNKEQICASTDILFSRISTHEYVVKLYHQKDKEEILENPLESKIIVNTQEGKKIAYYTTKYERMTKYREQVIEQHGLKCQICGFDFEETYGFIGRDFIDVHHMKPLYDRDSKIVVDIEHDFISICSNCHQMIHRNKEDILSPNALIQMVKESKELYDLFR